MSITERSEILIGLFRVRADLGVLMHQCQEARALQIGVSVSAAQNIVNEALAELQPDPLCPSAPEFPTPKY